MALAAMQLDLIEAIDEEEQQRGALRKLRERGRTDDVDEIHLLRQEQAESRAWWPQTVQYLKTISEG